MFEGIKIVFGDDFSLNINPQLKEIDLEDYDIKSLKLKYEKTYCGCCEGDHLDMEIKPADLCNFINSGGIEKINELNDKIKELENKNNELKKEIKQFKNVFKRVNEKDANLVQDGMEDKDD